MHITAMQATVSCHIKNFTLRLNHSKENKTCLRAKGISNKATAIIRTGFLTKKKKRERDV
jgi:hypothetical protein